MLTRLNLDVPYSAPVQKPKGNLADQVSQVHEALDVLREERRRLMEALVAWTERLNKEGSLEISDASIVASQGIKFPVTQVNATDPNTLDDYEEGAWTPVLSFATPGDLAVTYAVQRGTYTKIGRTVAADFTIATSAFTHTTASGGVRLSGLPFTIAPDDGNYAICGSTVWQGITKAGYTSVAPQAASGNAFISFLASGSGVAFAGVTAADMPTGGAVALRGSIAFRI